MRYSILFTPAITSTPTTAIGDRHRSLSQHPFLAQPGQDLPEPTNLIGQRGERVRRPAVGHVWACTSSLFNPALADTDCGRTDRIRRAMGTVILSREATRVCQFLMVVCRALPAGQSRSLRWRWYGVLTYFATFSLAAKSFQRRPDTVKQPRSRRGKFYEPGMCPTPSLNPYAMPAQSTVRFESGASICSESIHHIISATSRSTSVAHTTQAITNQSPPSIKIKHRSHTPASRTASRPAPARPAPAAAAPRPGPAPPRASATA